MGLRLSRWDKLLAEAGRADQVVRVGRAEPTIAVGAVVGVRGRAAVVAVGRRGTK
jgi:hypothetical protein